MLPEYGWCAIYYEDYSDADFNSQRDQLKTLVPPEPVLFNQLSTKVILLQPETALAVARLHANYERARLLSRAALALEGNVTATPGSTLYAAQTGIQQAAVKAAWKQWALFPMLPVEAIAALDTEIGSKGTLTAKQKIAVGHLQNMAAIQEQVGPSIEMESDEFLIEHERNRNEERSNRAIQG